MVCIMPLMVWCSDGILYGGCIPSDTVSRPVSRWSVGCTDPGTESVVCVPYCRGSPSLRHPAHGLVLPVLP